MIGPLKKEQSEKLSELEKEISDLFSGNKLKKGTTRAVILEKFKECSSLIINLKNVFEDNNSLTKACEHFSKSNTFENAAKFKYRVGGLSEALRSAKIHGHCASLMKSLDDIITFIGEDLSVGENCASTVSISLRMLRNALFPKKCAWNAQCDRRNVESLEDDSVVVGFFPVGEFKAEGFGDAVPPNKIEQLKKTGKELRGVIQKWDKWEHNRNVRGLREIVECVRSFCACMDLTKYPEIAKRRDELIKLCNETIGKLEPRMKRVT